MEDTKIVGLNLKSVIWKDKVMVNVLTDATNKALNEALNEMDSWNKDLFKLKITKQGFILENVDLKFY